MSLQDAAIAANRFGLGARPGELKAISSDPRGWLKAQMDGRADTPHELAGLPSTLDAAEAFNRWLTAIGITAANANGLYGKDSKGGGTGAGLGGGMGGGVGGGTGEMAARPAGLPPGVSIEQSFGQTFFPAYAEAVEARMKIAVSTAAPFRERLVRFWGNHFTVSVSKPAAYPLAPVFERDVVRPRVTGAFGDMLLASTKHPGMLVYLDNYVSIGPDSFLARNPAVLPPYLREILKGLNENLGREILELHTMGVRSGYTQADVTTLAKIITGWTVRRAGDRAVGDGEAGAQSNPAFRFLAVAHEPGPLTLLGRTYEAAGVRQGEAALSDIARRPETARFIAAKLARHFIADDPPPAAVDRLAQTFRDTEGDLRQMALTLVDLPEAWAPGLAKFKPPEDYLASALRALNGKPELTGRQLVGLLQRMGQRPYDAPGPNGWADVAGEWIGPDPVWKRVEWADALAKGVADAKFDPAQLAEQALGPTLTPATRQIIRLADSPAQGLALFLTAPEFQRR